MNIINKNQEKIKTDKNVKVKSDMNHVSLMANFLGSVH